MPPPISVLPTNPVPTPTPGATNPISDHDDPQNDLAAVSASGPMTESPATVTMTPAPAPDVIAAPATKPTQGEDSIAKKPSKGKHFRPSKAKTARCVSTTPPFIPALTIFRGVSEREWSVANPGGTRAQFMEYFKELSDKQCQVRETGATTNDARSANITPQELEANPKAGEKAETKVVSILLWFENILTRFPASKKGAGVKPEPASRTSLLPPDAYTMHTPPRHHQFSTLSHFDPLLLLLSFPLPLSPSFAAFANTFASIHPLRLKMPLEPNLGSSCRSVPCAIGVPITSDVYGRALLA